jgi:hypothetical protein
MFPLYLIVKTSWNPIYTVLEKTRAPRHHSFPMAAKPPGALVNGDTSMRP